MVKTDEQAETVGAKSGVAGRGATIRSGTKSVGAAGLKFTRTDKSSIAQKPALKSLGKSVGAAGSGSARMANKARLTRKAHKTRLTNKARLTRKAYNARLTRKAYGTRAVCKVRKLTALLAAAMLSLFGMCLSACGTGENAKQTESKDYLRGVVVVDAGHGGVDGGVVGKKTGVKESELNLAVAKKLRDLLRSSGFTVVMTRENSAGLYGFPGKGFKRRDMEKRRDVILSAGADVVISVHMNYFSDGRRRGGQTFYLGGSKEGRALASFLQEELNALGERDYKPLAGDYYMLECSSVPSCIAECGFLSNAEDEALLLTDSYQSAVAYAIFKGVAAYFSAKIG